MAAELRLHTTSGVGQDDRSVQVLEIGSTRSTLPPSAVLAGGAGLRRQARPVRTWDGLVDPLGQGPAVWFQRMDAPRPQRNRIHVDVSVPHDEAEPRIRAALAAGGTSRYDAEAAAFWPLADADGKRDLHHDLAGPGRLSRSTTGPAVACRQGARFPLADPQADPKTTAAGLRMSTVSSG